MSKLFYSILVAGLFLSLLSAGRLHAQGEHLRELDFGEGAFEKVSERMGKLFELEWHGQNIRLSRNWTIEEQEEEVLDEAQAKELKKAIKELVDRGVPRDDAKEFAAKRLGYGAEHHASARPPFASAFYGTKVESGGASGRSSSGHHSRMYYATSRVSAQVTYLGRDPQTSVLRISFREKKTPKRRFEIRDDNNGGFNFEFEYRELLVRLHQEKEGNSQLIWIENDRVYAYTGKTLHQLIRNNTQAVEQALFPLFARLGIKMPIDKASP